MLDLAGQEFGGPQVAPGHRGFSTRPIERSLASEQGGRAELTFAREGLQCRVVTTIIEDAALQI